jgi:hypothetical protein
MPDSAVINSGCLAFVLNQIVIESELPFEFASDCFIQLATEAQRSNIKELLSNRIGGVRFYQPEEFYESEAIEKQTENGIETSCIPLPESKWRYYVVSTNDNSQANHNLHLASNISDMELEISALSFFVGGGQIWRSGIIQKHFDGFPRPAKRIGNVELKDLAEVYQSFIAFDGDEYPEIIRAMNMLDSLSFLMENSPFHVLGLFAIIELLITHNPKLEDRGDSITHQMQSKIPLLSRRFQKALNYSEFFLDAKEQKVWAALYKYRSAMAHGGVSDFSNGDLKVLKDAKNADLFLKEVVKSLLRHSLKEPQLYRDLRNC